MFSDCMCSLLSKPDHVMVGEGSNARFACQSTIPHGISWRFTPLGGFALELTDGMTLPSGANVSISYIADQKRSTLILHGVGKEDTGIIACVDAREKSFADLTVISEYSLETPSINQSIKSHVRQSSF